MIARETVAQSILGFMTSKKTEASTVPDNQETVMDSMLSNIFLEVGHKIQSLTPVNQYPRYASYKFSAMGFASVKIPVELLTSALVFKVYEQITREWEKRPTNKEVTMFLGKCGIKARTKIDPTTTTEKLIEKIEEEAKNEIQKHNIVYLIELARLAAELLSDRGITDSREFKYKRYAETMGNQRWNMLRDREGWKKPQDCWRTPASILSTLTTLFGKRRNLYLKRSEICLRPKARS